MSETSRRILLAEDDRLLSPTGPREEIDQGAQEARRIAQRQIAIKIELEQVRSKQDDELRARQEPEI